MITILILGFSAASAADFVLIYPSPETSSEFQVHLDNHISGSILSVRNIRDSDKPDKIRTFLKVLSFDGETLHYDLSMSEFRFIRKTIVLDSYAGELSIGDVVWIGEDEFPGVNIRLELWNAPQSAGRGYFTRSVHVDSLPSIQE